MPLDGNSLSADGSADTERKLVTILFADIVSSSALVSGRDPEDADHILRPVLDLFAAAVVRYGGLVAQVMGDGILAVFGAPTALEDHALRACLAAEDVVRSIHARRDRPGDVAVRIGVASGEVVLQQVRIAACRDLRVVGESVHLAAKLQQRAEPNSVLLAHETVALTKGQVATRPAGVLRLATDAPARPVFELVEARAGRRTAGDVFPVAGTPFVGRSAELATLRLMWQATVRGRGRCLVLSGEAGIGKSTLTAAFLREVSAEGYRCLQWPQSELRRLGEPEALERVADSLVQAMAERGDGIERLLSAVERGAGALARAGVEMLLQREPHDVLWHELNAEQKLALTVEGLAGGLAELSRDEPVFVLVEDAHWADTAMGRFLDAVVTLAPGTGVCLVVTRRVEENGGWATPLHTPMLSLPPLTRGQMARFLDSWLGNGLDTADLKLRLAERSQGIPLYLEESLRTLEANGAIIGRRGDFRVVDAGMAMLLPPSVHGLIAARIDTLAAAARKTLLRAAVIGDFFDVGLLRSLEPVAPERLPAVLDALAAAGFIRQVRVLPNLEYGFTHALTREAAYRTLTLGERRTLHAHLLAAIRRRRTADLPNRLALMAHHAFLAERWAAACVYGHAAGRYAETRSKLVEATEHYQQVLAALGHLPDTRKNRIRTLDLCIDIPRVFLPRGIPAGNGLLPRAAVLAERDGDRGRLAQALSMEASFLWVAGRLDEAAILCRRALSALEGDGAARLPVITRLGGILTDLGHLSEAEDVLTQAVRLSADEGTQSFPTAGSARVAARCYLTRLLAERGDRDGVRRTAILATDAARDCGHPFTDVLTGVHIGWAAAILGDHALALAHLDEANVLAETIRSPLWQPLILGLSGYSQGMATDVAEGLRRIDRALTALDASAQHNRVHIHHVMLFQAELLSRAGRRGDAVAAALRARDGFRAHAQDAYAAKATAFLAGLNGDPDTGKDVSSDDLADALAVARKEGLRPVELRCLHLIRRGGASAAISPAA